MFTDAFYSADLYLAALISEDYKSRWKGNKFTEN